MNKLYEETLKIAERKLVHDDTGSVLKSPRIGTGGSFVDIFLWDTAFCIMWAKYDPVRFPVANSLDNFYASQDDDGFISRQYLPSGISKWGKKHPVSFAPPLLGWAELEFERATGSGRLPRVYPHLLKQHQYNWQNFRRDDGLFFCDCWGCGMDNMPRWDDESEITPEGGIPLTLNDVYSEEMLTKMQSWSHFHFDWNKQLGWCETTCQMAFNAKILAEIAALTGNEKDIPMLEQQHKELAALVNELCYNPETGLYHDVLNGRPLKRKHIGAYWALISEVAEVGRAERMIAELRNPATFNRPCGVPSLSADDPDYDPEGGYWRGPIWCPTTYMLLRGLVKYNEENLAREIAVKFYRAVEAVFNVTGTIWENYSPEQCYAQPQKAGSDFCGWSALAPVTIYREFIEN